MKKTKTKLSLIIVTIMILAIGLILCFQLKPKIMNRPNIVLIILDCLRADHLGCYGYERDTSPNIDALAENGLIFSNAFSQGGYTVASIPSIFTSKFPLSHGVFLNNGNKLDADEPTLAKILKNNGYATAGFTGGGYTSHAYGFGLGFDLYKETDWGDMKEVNQLAFDWLETKQEKPFFLFLHSYSIHDPFSPPEPFSKLYAANYNGQLKNIGLDCFLFEEINKGVLTLSKEDMEYIASIYSRPLFEKINKETLTINKEDMEYIISQYDGGIRYCDEHMGKLFKKIDSLGLASNTIIILTSDHGEDLMDHGTISHGDIYDTGIHVPLIIKYPCLFPKNKKISPIVRSIDILPTILDALGLPIEPEMEGKSMLPLAFRKEDKQERAVFSFGVHSKLKYRIAMRPKKMRISLRIKDWKLISSYDITHNRLCNTEETSKELDNQAFTKKPEDIIFQDELYNLEKDPKELNNLALVNKKQLTILKKKLNNYIKRLKLPIKKDRAILDEKTRQQLKSLGYAQ